MLASKDVLQSYAVVQIKQCWLECECGHEEVGIWMRKLWHYPENSFDGKTSNEVITMTKTLTGYSKYFMSITLELPYHTTLLMKNTIKDNSFMRMWNNYMSSCVKIKPLHTPSRHSFLVNGGLKTKIWNQRNFGQYLFIHKELKK